MEVALARGVRFWTVLLVVMSIAEGTPGVCADRIDTFPSPRRGLIHLLLGMELAVLVVVDRKTAYVTRVSLV